MYEGAVYIADETNFELYNGSDSITASSECFFQLLALFSEILGNNIEDQNKSLTFTRNSAIVSGDEVFGR